MSSGLSPGDFGRRVAWWRDKLGLSRADVAERSGIIESYLAYLETNPATPTSQTILRLSRALDVSPEELLGGHALLPPGQGRAAPAARLVALSREDCLGLVAVGGVGRVAYVTSDGPMILPVNFALTPEGVLFRTSAESPMVAQVGKLVAFEVDGVDEVKSEGWSVVIVGAVRLIADDEEKDLLAEWMGIEPWAGGHRDTYLCVALDRVTGRMIRTD